MEAPTSKHQLPNKHDAPSTKLQTTSKFQAAKSNRELLVIPSRPPFDLEERTFEFAKAVRLFAGSLPRTVTNIEDVRQLIRSSGSVGANYREANEALSKKDFLLRIRISRKEAKECVYWLKLIQETNTLNDSQTVDRLIREANELTKILSSLASKST